MFDILDGTREMFGLFFGDGQNEGILIIFTFSLLCKNKISGQFKFVKFIHLTRLCKWCPSKDLLGDDETIFQMLNRNFRHSIINWVHVNEACLTNSGCVR